VIALLVAAGAAVGAPSRYTADVLVTRATGGRFPLGTLSVNMVGSFVLGLVTGLGLHHGLSPGGRALLGTGFCGTFTTFSTFSLESVGLLRDRRPRAAAANLLGSTVLGLALAAIGLAVALT
jgi:CrcB protein